jgi:hypothetical protein
MRKGEVSHERLHNHELLPSGVEAMLEPRETRHGATP